MPSLLDRNFLPSSTTIQTRSMYPSHHPSQNINNNPLKIIKSRNKISHPNGDLPTLDNLAEQNILVLNSSEKIDKASREEKARQFKNSESLKRFPNNINQEELNEHKKQDFGLDILTVNNSKKRPQKYNFQDVRMLTNYTNRGSRTLYSLSLLSNEEDTSTYRLNNYIPTKDHRRNHTKEKTKVNTKEEDIFITLGTSGKFSNNSDRKIFRPKPPKANSSKNKKELLQVTEIFEKNLNPLLQDPQETTFGKKIFLNAIN